MKGIISNLNKLFDSRIRLGIMSVLAANEWVNFNTLKELLDVTDGNLASHLTSLEKNELIRAVGIDVSCRHQDDFGTGTRQPHPIVDGQGSAEISPNNGRASVNHDSLNAVHGPLSQKRDFIRVVAIEIAEGP